MDSSEWFMTLQEGVYSLKIECNLRNLGYVNIHGTTIARCGNYFVRPIGFNSVNNMEDFLWGFQAADPEVMMLDFLLIKSKLQFASTAKIILDKLQTHNC